MSRWLEVVLLGFLALAITAAVVAGRRSAGGEVAFDLRASSLLAGPHGSRALYDVLARLRVPVERRRTPLFDLTKGGRRGRLAVLVVLDPPLGLVPAELAQVVRFVRSGGAVVGAGAGGGIGDCVGWRTGRGGRFSPPGSFPRGPPNGGLPPPPPAGLLEPVPHTPPPPARPGPRPA